MKDARNTRAAGAQPDIAFSLRQQTGAARREAAFIWQGGRHPFGRLLFPRRAAVIGRDDEEASVHRVAHRNAVLRIPKGEGVKKCFWLAVFELQRPVLAAVGCLVNARGLAIADAQQVRRVRVKGFDIAEVELFRAGHLSGLPGLAAIKGADVSALCATGPSNLFADGAEAAKAGGGVAGLWLPLRKGIGRKGQRHNTESQKSKSCIHCSSGRNTARANQGWLNRAVPHLLSRTGKAGQVKVDETFDLVTGAS